MQMHSLKLLCPRIYEKMHLQENTSRTLTQNVARYPLHHVTYAPTKFEVATSNGLRGDAFKRKKNI